MENTDTKLISSAEMTAYWRTRYPKLSGDALSDQLISPEGAAKSKQFEMDADYPKAGRHFSARAGFFLTEAVNALTSRHYDTVISLGSGFSLLTYYIAHAVGNENIRFIDVDLSNILQLRKQRIQHIEKQLDKTILNRIEMLALDLDRAAAEKKDWHELFLNCKSPLVIIEGLIYFLNFETVSWLFEQMSAYPSSMVLIDYFTKDGPSKSACFARVLKMIQGSIPENVKTFFGVEDITRSYPMKLLKDMSLQEAENLFSIAANEKPQLNDPNEMILARFAVLKK